MSSLHELTNNYMELSNDYKALLELSDGVEPGDEQMFIDMLESIRAEIALKVDSYAYLMQSMESKMKQYQEESERLIRLTEKIETNLERMDAALLDAMRATGKTELNGEIHKFKIVNNGGVLPVVYTGETPANYQKTVTKTVNDTEKIRADLEAGIELSFAHLGERGQRLKADWKRKKRKG